MWKQAQRMKTTARVDAAGVELHVATCGEGPPLLLTHGMLCSCRMFDRVVPDLAERFRVVTFDFSGHGRSGSASGKISFERLILETESVQEALEVRHPVFVGFSMGGMAGMRLALRDPKRFRALVLANASAGAHAFAERQGIHALATLTHAFGIRRRALQIATQQMFSDAFIEAEPDTERDWSAAVRGMRKRDIARTTHLVAGRKPILPALASLPLPALVIGSEWDTATPPEEADAIARALPGSVFVRIPRAGHATPLEAPGAVVDAIVNFVDNGLDENREDCKDAASTRKWPEAH